MRFSASNQNSFGVKKKRWKWTTDAGQSFFDRQQQQDRKKVTIVTDSAQWARGKKVVLSKLSTDLFNMRSCSKNPGLFKTNIIFTIEPICLAFVSKGKIRNLASLLQLLQLEISTIWRMRVCSDLGTREERNRRLSISE